MRGFIVMCLVACTVAAPQYNYQPSGGFQGVSVGSPSGNSGFGSVGLGSDISGQSLNFGNNGGSGLGGQGISFGGVGFNSRFSSGAAHHHQQAPIVTKQFYIHSAPEEQADDGIQKTVSLGPSHKNYRVIFIKAPHSAPNAASVRFTAPQNEEKTVIYVLSKKTDAADIQTNIDAAHSAPSKPEVFFIKYKTHEEAEHAQRQIQAQYDSLGGSSHVSDEGVAPITSVVGALGDGNSGSSSHGNNFGGVGSSSSNNFHSSSLDKVSYLPPSH